MSTEGVASHSTAVDTAHYHPDKDPPRAEQADDEVEEMVGTVSLYVGCADLKEGGRVKGSDDSKSVMQRNNWDGEVASDGLE